MARMTLVKYYLKLSTLLFSLILLVFLAMGTVLAQMDLDGNKIDKTTAKVTRHMDKMKQKYPGIDGKKKQIEQKLRNGTMRPKDACSHCHIKGRSSGP